MTVPRAFAIPAVVAVILTVIGAWVDGSRSSSAPPEALPAAAAASTAALSPTTPPGPATTTSCTSVVHVGDSTSVGLIDENYIADPTARIDAQYRRVGVTDPRLEIAGARSVVERYQDEPNADDVASAAKAAGYEGCWVLALGVTDSANVAAGSPTDHAERIERMMTIIGDDPILWPTVKTLEPEGEWSGANMLPWNAALLAARDRHPNIAVYDWAAVVQDPWFQDDGIHYTSAGNAERARLLADALVTAYPAQ